MVTLTKYGAKYNRNILFLEGLSTDTKPTGEFDGLSVQNGSEYTEVDTGKKFLFDYDNATWYEAQTGGGTSGGIVLVGTTTTQLTDGATTNPITVDGQSYTAQPNDAVIYGNKEFLFDGTNWHEFGDLSGLSSNDIGAMTGYAKASTGSAIATTDTLNQAIGKVEKRVEVNENNISLVSGANGAKNKVDYDLARLKTLNTSGTWKDNVYTAGAGDTLSITYNTDNTISISGTISSQFLFNLNNTIDNTVSGNILSGGASPTILRLQHLGGNYETYADSTGSGATIATIPEGYVLRLIIVIPANQTINVKVSPMICDSALYSIDDTYQPYSMTNAELTAAIQAIQAQLAGT